MAILKKILITILNLFNPFSANSKKKEPTFEEMLQMAKDGNDKAQFNVAMMYEEGDGVEQNDAEAIKWYEKVAVLGDAVAQSKLRAANNKGK